MKTKAEISLEVNGRGLGSLNEQIEEAFDSARVEEFSSTTEEATQVLREAGGAARELSDNLEDSNDEFEGFKAAKQTIADVRRESKELNRSLRETVRLLRQTQQGGGPGRGAGGGGGSGPGGIVSDARGSGGDARQGRAGALAGVLAGVPIFAALAGGMAAVSRTYGTFLARETSRRDSFAARQGAQTGDLTGASGLEGAGQAFGYAAPAAQQMYGQFMSRAGAPLGSDAFSSGLGANFRYGVDLGEAGAQMQAFRRGSSLGDAGAQEAFENTLRQAVGMGLDGSELSSYMQSQTQLVQRQVELGARGLDLTSFRDLEGMLGGRVGGLQAQRMAREFSTGVSDIGYSGAGTASEFLLAQQAGYSPGSGIESYFAALQEMQDISSNPEFMEGYLSRFVTEGAGEAQNIAMLQYAYRDVTGTNLHQDAARAYLGGGGAGALMPGAIDLGTTGVAGALQEEAQFQNDLANLGEGFQEFQATMHRLDITVLGIVQKLEGPMTGVVNQIDNLVDMDWQGIMADAQAMWERIMALIERFT